MINVSRITFWPFILFQLAGVFLLIVILRADSEEIVNSRNAWRSAVLAAGPRLMVDRSLVKLEALLNIEPSFPTAICTWTGETVVRNHRSGINVDCSSSGNGVEKATLIYDSKPVGSVVIGSISYTAILLKKYFVIATIWIMASMLFFAMLRRRSDLNVLDGLLAYMKSENAKPVLFKWPVAGRRIQTLVDAVVNYRDTQDRLQAVESAYERNRVVTEIAAQVSHDIRSPLASLLAVSHSAEGLDERSRILLRGAVNAIRDIASNLLRQQKQLPGVPLGASDSVPSISQFRAWSDEARSVEFIYTLLETVVAQKRSQSLDRSSVVIEFEPASDAYRAFASVQPTEFGRMLSNLLNNAIEASEVGESICVRVCIKDSSVLIEIVDNGRGVPPEILEKLGFEALSYGKNGVDSGFGRGVLHAKATTEFWGGQFSISSKLKQGTTVSIALPLESVPSWFPDQINISPNSLVIILDDDPGIHEVWKTRLRSIESKYVRILHCYIAEDVLRWYRESLGDVQSPLYLFDFELAGSKHTGLDVIEMLGLGNRAILVTSHFEDLAIRQRCVKDGVRILPKTFAAVVPLKLTPLSGDGEGGSVI